MMKIRVNNEALAKSLGYRVDEIVDVKCRQGVPIDKEWRNRIKDSSIDGCIEIVKEKKGKN